MADCESSPDRYLRLWTIVILTSFALVIAGIFAASHVLIYAGIVLFGILLILRGSGVNISGWTESDRESPSITRQLDEPGNFYDILWGVAITGVALYLIKEDITISELNDILNRWQP